MFYDYCDSGSWTESTYRANSDDFQSIKLRQRVAVNMENRSTATKMVGLDVKMPVAIAPVGLTGMQSADGEIKALWIACTNPAQSMPDQATVRRALERAEFVVLQEAFATTSTARYADLLLPATTWGEKEGTVTNSERRISRVRAAVSAPRQARHDWQIALDFAKRLESPGRPTLFPYATPESIWLEHRASTRGRDLDITPGSDAYNEIDALSYELATLGLGAQEAAHRVLLRYAQGEDLDAFAEDDGTARLPASTGRFTVTVTGPSSATTSRSTAMRVHELFSAAGSGFGADPPRGPASVWNQPTS